MKTADYSNITIAFSGHNIKNFLILAIQSFLYCYPKLKEQIVVFDDNSNDGTSEWLKKEKIRKISWSVHEVSAKKIDPRRSSTIALRVNLIISEIMRQTKTRYLLLNDGDVLFLKKGFIENYLAKIPGHIGSIFVREYQAKPCSDKNAKYLQKKYATLKTGNNNNLLGAWLFHSFLDLDLLKKNKVFFDRLDDRIYNENLGILVDSGNDFLLQLHQKRLSHHLINPALLDKYLVHFTYIGSLSRFSDISNKLAYSRKNVKNKIINKLSVAQLKIIPAKVKKLLARLDLEKAI